MYSKLQFDLNEQNKLVISFKQSSDTEDLRDKIAKRFFEEVDNNFSLLRLQYDDRLTDGRYQTGEIFPVKENQILGILSGEIDYQRKLQEFSPVDAKNIVLMIEENEDPRTRIFDAIKGESGIQDFKELLRIIQIIGYKLGTTPLHNYGWDSGLKIDLFINGEVWIIECHLREEYGKFNKL